MFGRLPPLHTLAAFEAVARHLSFAKAAEELCLTHSAISHRIRHLEQHLGTRVFRRLNRTIALTSEGERFLESVRYALRLLHAASTEISPDLRSSLRISVAPAFASNWLIQRIGSFQRLHPEVELEIQATSLLASLQAGQSDVAIRYGRGEWPGVTAIRLLETSLIGVCSPQYRRMLGPIDGPQVIARVTLLRHPLMPWPRFLQAINYHGQEPVRGPLFSEVSVMLEAAASSQGVALAPSALLAPLLESRRLVKLLDAAIDTDHTYYAVCLAEARERRAVSAFIEWLIDTASVDASNHETLVRAPAACA